MKTNSTFKMPREFKCMLATISNSHRRGAVKDLFVQAQQTFVENKNRRSREKVNLGDE